MGKQIHTTFETSEDARAAERYFREQGFERVATTQNEVSIETTDENWLAAYEIATSFGGEVETALEETEHAYNIAETIESTTAADPPIPNEEMETELVNPQSYVDANFGYGDYELVEPYILHRSHKLANETESDPTEKEAP